MLPVCTPHPPSPPIIIVINSHDVICINKLGWFGTGKWACRCPNLRERRFVKVAEGGFSAVMEPSLETGGVLDTPLWGMMAEFGAGVCDGAHRTFVMKNRSDEQNLCPGGLSSCRRLQLRNFHARRRLLIAGDALEQRFRDL